MKRKPEKLKPAPDDLRLVEAFVNTAIPRKGIEELSSPQALADWLIRHSLLPAGTELGEEDLAIAIEVRESLRAMLLANNGARLPERAMQRLDRAASRARQRPRVAADGTTYHEPAGEGLDGVIARLLDVVGSAQLDGRWPRMKACAYVECRRAFYDFSSNRSARWCSRSRCANKVHARAYRARYRRIHGRTPRGGV